MYNNAMKHICFVVYVKMKSVQREFKKCVGEIRIFLGNEYKIIYVF